MKLLTRCAPLALFLQVPALLAQTPGPGTPKAATPPGGKRVPAEVTPTPATSPAKNGEPAKPMETPSTPTLSPGSHPVVPEKNSSNPVDALSPADLDQVLPLLKSHYYLPAALSDADIKRATLQGLLERLSPKVSLVTTSTPAAAEPSPFKTEVLDNRLGYIRLGSLANENVTQLDPAIQGFVEKKLAAVVLDLRATPPGTNFEMAAEVCRRFCPKGKILFTVRQPNEKDQIFTSRDESQFHGILVVLTSSETAGSGEIIAGVLRNLAKALVIGQKTKGEAAGFEVYPLSNGTALRVPVTEFVLPGDAEPIVAGLKPDVPVEMTAEGTKEILKQELEKGVAALVQETERARLNEAALVAGTNPDLDAMIAAQKAHGDRAKAPLRDAVLQRAMDLVTSIAIYEKGNRVR